jgi:hypothetical protein
VVCRIWAIECCFRKSLCKSWWFFFTALFSFIGEAYNFVCFEIGICIQQTICPNLFISVLNIGALYSSEIFAPTYRVYLQFCPPAQQLLAKPASARNFSSLFACHLLSPSFLRESWNACKQTLHILKVVCDICWSSSLEIPVNYLWILSCNSCKKYGFFT